MRNAIFTMAAVSILGFACGGQPNDGSGLKKNVLPSTVDCRAGSATLEGKFVAPNLNTPVAGGEVAIPTARGCNAGTGADGSFKFLNVPSGVASISAKKGALTATANATPGAVATLAIDPNSVKIGYVRGAFDSIQTVVQRLGFTATQLAAADLSSASLSQYQAVLLNCGADDRHATEPATKSNLTSFVNGGGVLYVSDWAYSYVQSAFPGHVTFLTPDPHVGDDGEQTAEVVDEALHLALGKTTAAIDFNLSGWVVIDSTPSSDELLAGPVMVNGASKGAHPYAAQFAVGQGRVTYTSFHNEAQTTADMDKLLEQMLLGL